MREKSRFRAQGDDGAVYEIIEYGSRIDTSHMDGRGSLDGLGELWTADGSSRVNDMGDGQYRIVSNGAVVRKIN